MAAGSQFTALAFAVKPVVTISGGAGTLNTTNLPAGTAIAGFMDPVAGVRIFNPYVVGLGASIQSGDALGKWLPVVASSNGLTAAQVTDNLQSTAPNEVGQVTLTLTPGTADTVNAPSVMSYKLSPQALVITVTSATW